jgi:HSP20 family molecular chaperone IbpA
MVELGKSDTQPFHYRHNVEVNLTDHMLTIWGEKKKEQEVKEQSYYRSERS